MALRGLRVIEIAGLAPAPYAGMILSDFGADVIRVDKVGVGSVTDVICRGKRSIAVNLKTPEGQTLMRRLCSSADALIEPFRPGVMERLGLGPEILMKLNPCLIYARMTGYGQTGYYSARAGHDINYLAIAGVLSNLGRAGEKPHVPGNMLADFAGGGMSCALGILLAVIERMKSGKGQVVDANMVDGSAYIASQIIKGQELFAFNQPKGTNLLDGGAAFYDTYETKDGKYVAVGALEAQFYRELSEGLGIDIPQFSDQNEMRDTFTKLFATKTRDEWAKIFDGKDACVTPVLTVKEAAEHPHNKERRSFFTNKAGFPENVAAPRLQRTPGLEQWKPDPINGEHTREVLKEVGYTLDEIKALEENEIIEQSAADAKRILSTHL